MKPEEKWPWEYECTYCHKPANDILGVLKVRKCGQVEHADCHEAHVQLDYAW